MDHEIRSEKQQESLHNLTGALHASGKTAVFDSSALGRFRLWHRRQALEAVTMYVDRGQDFLQLLQATILITASDQLNAWWADVWQMAGSCIRLAVPMRIYQSSAIPPSSFTASGDGACPDAKDPLEQAEMDRTWWMAYLMERTASMWTTWPLAMAEDEISCELPVLQSTYDKGYGDLLGVQSIHAKDLYINHPPRHLDSFPLFIKAVKLFADVQRFFRSYQRQKHSIDRYINEPGLHLLLSQVNLFRLSIPVHMRRPTEHQAAGGQLDRDLLAAIMLAHGTSVALGEPLATKDTWQHDLARMGLGAIRTILSLLYDSELHAGLVPIQMLKYTVTATSYDITLLPASISYVFLGAAKGLLRFVHAANQVGDEISASVFRSELGVFQCVLL